MPSFVPKERQQGHADGGRSCGGVRLLRRGFQLPTCYNLELVSAANGYFLRPGMHRLNRNAERLSDSREAAEMLNCGLLFHGED